MSTFALVHGAWHGAWCWERFTPELEALGHRVITLDLPIDDGSASFDDYADVVCAALSDVVGDDLILVGHSLAGQIVPLVAAQRPLRRLVYLSLCLRFPDTPSSSRWLRRRRCSTLITHRAWVKRTPKVAGPGSIRSPPLGTAQTAPQA
jgi:pimeloyl-ACP methyl ester carboxylesterase